VVALRLYLVGLPFAAIDLLLVYAFYARQDTLTPALVGLLSLMIYMAVALLLAPTYGLFSLMIADSVKHIVHATLSAYLLNRRVGGMGEQALLNTTLRTTIAVLVMGAAARAVLVVARDVIGSGSLLREVLLVLVSGGLSAAVFLGLALFVLNITEIRWLAAIVRRRIARS
jgi:putative peptidoglycan lipid II flippase